MTQANVINFTTQIEGMIAFADAAQDFVLAAWLTEALIRMKAHDNSVKAQIYGKSSAVFLEEVGGVHERLRRDGITS